MAGQDESTYGFSKDDASALANMIGLVETEIPSRRLHSVASGSAVHALTPGGGIPARSTLTMGSATCDIYNCSSAGVLSDSTNNATIYNMATSAVAGSTHIIASRNAAGLLVVIVEDCG